MTVRVQDILNSLNVEAPFRLAESWDNVGLLIGNPDQEVTKVLVGLDPTNALIDEAIALCANTVITHHPVIFKPLQAINTATPGGKLLQKALSNGISIISCHTNYDIAQTGVSAILAEQLGLEHHSPLVISADGASSNAGLGRIGVYQTPMPSAQFTAKLLTVLNLQSVQMAGRLPEKISTVAVCGGSGSDLAQTAQIQGADVYLSAEIKHNTAIWAVEYNFCIIDGTHYATEKPAVALLVKLLEQVSYKENWHIMVFETQVERHPFVTLNRKA